MAPLAPAMKKGDLVPGVVKGTQRGEVLFDIGEGYEGVLRSRVPEKFRKGQHCSCHVKSVDYYSRRLILKTARDSHHDPTDPDLALHGLSGKVLLALPDPFDSDQFFSCGEEEADEGWQICGWGHHASGKPLSALRVGKRVDGVVTRIHRHRVYVDIGAAKDGMILPPSDNRAMDYQKGNVIQNLRIHALKRREGILTLSLPDPNEKDVIGVLERDWGHCIALYVHGSTIFSNKEPDDIDLLAVVDDQNLKKTILCDMVDSQFKLGRYEVSVYTRSQWMSKMELMDLTMLTCLSLPDRFILHETDHSLRSFQLDLLKLHESILSYAEFTWVKAHFMLESRRDVFKSSKNLYFVFRVLELGRQLLKHGKIVDFKAANPWWEKVRKLYSDLHVQPGDWDILETFLGMDVQQEFQRFHDALTPRLCSLLPGVLPLSLRRAVAANLVSQPGICGPAKQTQECKENAQCCCGHSIEPGEPTVTLARCRHRFHRGCALVRLRKKAVHCWTCHQPVQLGLDKEVLSAYMGQQDPSGNRRRRFGGYPATVLLEQEAEPILDAKSARALMRQMML